MDKFLIKSRKRPHNVIDTSDGTRTHSTNEEPILQHTRNAPDSSDPGPSDPGRIYPGSSNPGPSNPGPINPGPSNPGPSNPGPSNPGPSNPGPSNLEPSHPGPSNVEDSRPDSNVHVAPPPPKKRKVEFCDSWLKDAKLSSWLTKKNNTTPFCRVCGITLTLHKPALIRHAESKHHVKLMIQISKNKKIEEAWHEKTDLTKEKVRRAELKLSSFLAAHNLSFSLMDSLTPLLADIFPDSTIAKELKLGRTKTTAIVKTVLAPEFENKINNQLKGPTDFYSLIMDETTDCSVQKQCAFTVTYLDKYTNTVKTAFLDMKQAKSGKAEDLFICLKQMLEDRGIPIANLIGYSSDTTNSMFGEINSMFTRLKEQNPSIVCVKCSCHLIHLAASKACLKLPKSVEDLLRNVGSYFSRSAARIKKLQEMQEFFKVEIHKILTVATTRWLSVKQCVDRVLEQYDVLINYFRLETFDDPSRINDDINNTLNNKFSKIYLEFISYVLGLLTDFNVLFQSESPLLYKLKPSVDHLVQTITINYMQLNQCKNKPKENIEYSNPRHFLPLKDVYLGIAAQESLTEMRQEANGPPELEINNFLKSCLAFYIELIKQITIRFDFRDPIFDIVAIVDPKNAQKMNMQTLTQVLDRFPMLKGNNLINMQELEQEWREHSLLDQVEHDLSTQDMEEYWKKVFAIKTLAGNQKFSNLKTIIALILILPFSNASVERVFSSLKRIKTDDRNKLNTDTVAALMKTSQGIKYAGGCIKWEPSAEMLRAKIKYD